MASQQYPKAKALLDKFHAGKCTPEELALLNSWYDGIRSEVEVENTLAQRERFLAAFRQHVAHQHKSNIRPFIWKWSAAAAVLLLAGSVYFLGGYHKAAPPANTAAAVENIFRVRNTSNVIKKVVLPDSSVIWMNANATLSFREDAGNKTRQVSFQGEGYFEVNRSAQSPFVIVTRDLVVNVLGTSFNLEAYPEEKMTRVSLTSGKVQVAPKQNNFTKTILEPGQAASYFREDSLLATYSIDTTLTAAWMQGGFTANQLTVKDAFTRLCERSGYELNWENERHLQKRITINFPKQTFVQTLDDLCYMTRKKYRISNKIVTIF